jgi:hypothetical protein
MFGYRMLGVVASELPLQLNPSNSLIQEKINELEKSLKDAGRQSDTELITYYKDFINFLRKYQEQKLSHAYINGMSAGDDELGEVNAARFIKRYVPIKEGNKMWINSKISISEKEFQDSVNRDIAHYVNKAQKEHEEETKDEEEKEGSSIQINSKVALINGNIIKISKTQETLVAPLSTNRDMNEMGVPQVTQEQEVPEVPSVPAKSFHSDFNYFIDSGGSRDTTDSKDKVKSDGSQNSGTSTVGCLKGKTDEYRIEEDELNTRNKFEETPTENDKSFTKVHANLTTELKGEESEDSTDNVISSEEVNPVITKYDKVSFVVRNTSDKYANLEALISKIALDNNISDVEFINVKLDKEKGSVEFKTTSII